MAYKIAKSRETEFQRLLSSYEPDPLTLSFRSQHDALDFANQCVQDGIRGLAANSINFVEHYKTGKLEIVFNISPRARDGEYQLIFAPIELHRGDADICIGLDHGCVWFSFEERIAPRFEISQVLLCARDAQFWA